VFVKADGTGSCIFDMQGGTISGNTASGAVGPYRLGHAVIVINVARTNAEAYHNANAGTTDDFTVDWNGSSYTTISGFDH
jgi:hypothetical protein